MIKRGAADLTSRSLREADPTSGSLRKEIGGARLSCPRNRDGLSNGVHRTRQARPSEKRTWQAGPSRGLIGSSSWDIPSREHVGVQKLPAWPPKSLSRTPKPVKT